MSLSIVKVRASVTIGSHTVETPNVLSFTVKKSRGQSSTFDASLKISAGASISGGSDVTISAGKDSPSLIFTGIVKRAQISPCWEDPSYSILTISGNDVLTLLENKKYTRRCRGTSVRWAIINEVVRPGLRSGKLNFASAGLAVAGSLEMMSQGNSNVSLVNKPKSAANTPFDPTIQVAWELKIDTDVS